MRAKNRSSSRRLLDRDVLRNRVLLIVAWGLTGGCASFSDSVRPALDALDRGEPEKALTVLNDRMDVATGEDLPAEVVGDNAVLLLDRGMVHHAVRDWNQGSTDLATADEAIQLLDFTRTTLDEVGRYLFSDSAGQYRAPSYEKLLIPTMQMVSYLARDDLQGTLVEARRLTVMQDFIERNDGLGAGLLGAGSYLAGFANEKAGRPEEALRYYSSALEGSSFRSLDAPVARLFPESGFRTPTLEEAASRAAGVAPLGDDEGEILVITLYGRVPQKIAKRIPIGLALTYASLWLSPAKSQTARRLAGQGLVTWVNYPELAPVGGPYAPPDIAVDAGPVAGGGIGAAPVGLVQDVYPVQDLVVAAWEKERGAVVAAAIVRLLTRVAAGQVAQTAAGRNNAAGALLSLGTQAALTAADVPDTRSWATLPANIGLARAVVPAGEHRVRVGVRGAREEARVVVRGGGYAVVVAISLR